MEVVYSKPHFELENKINEQIPKEELNNPIY